MCYKAGPDSAPFTADDELQDLLSLEYGDGKLVKEISYSGKGIQSYHSVYDYDSNGKKIKTVRYDPEGTIVHYMSFEYDPQDQVIKDVEYKGPGKDGQWFTPDDEIEKYHAFNYGEKNKLERAMEYHAEHNGQGQDNIWFTSDDPIFATKEFFYSDDGMLIQEKKYIGAGPDGQWFTGDDLMQYYVMYHYLMPK